MNTMIRLRTLTHAVAICCTAALPLGFAQQLTYTSPSCQNGVPTTSSPSWACGAWPTTTPPVLGTAGTKTIDPDTGNRVLRVTQSGSYGEPSSAAFKTFDGGSRFAWSADSSKFIILSWGGSGTDYWVGFNPSNMSLTNSSGHLPPFDNHDESWDPADSTSSNILGLLNGVLVSYNISNGVTVTTTVFNPASVAGWGGTAYASLLGGTLACIMQGPQDYGTQIVCYDRKSRATTLIDLLRQTINNHKLKVTMSGTSIRLPSTVTIHSFSVAKDGNYVAIDTRGNTACSSSSGTPGTSTALFINLTTNQGYEWNKACGYTHWAYGYSGTLIQNASPAFLSGCTSDSRGFWTRPTGSTIDTNDLLIGPCSYNPSSWSIALHMNWANNAPTTTANQYPVLATTFNEGAGNMFLFNDIAMVQPTTSQSQSVIWRFAQTWNDQWSSSGTQNNCSFLDYTTGQVSPDGKWAIYPSDWEGGTGVGVCQTPTGARRTDVFLFELK